jgi:two-component system NtrC family response regulator
MSGKRGLLPIVEGDPALQNQMSWVFANYEVVVAGDREPALTQVRRHDTNAALLLLGEFATGKELLACALHDLSQRRT